MRIHHLLLIATFLTLLTHCSCTAFAQEVTQPVPLSEEEQAWLKANPSIKVGIFPTPPYTFVKNGQNQGYLVEMMQLLAGQAGFTQEFSMQTLPETFAQVKSGQLHAVLGIMRNEERAGFMYFSENVLKLQIGIFARASRTDIRDVASLKNKIIATRKGYGLEHVVKKYLPDATIIRAEDAEGMLQLVASGEADATIRELHSGEYILHNSFINNVNVKGFFTPPGLPETEGSEFAVSKKFPLLISILNKAYNAIPESEKTELWRKWFASVESQEKTIELTPEEQAWLDQNHTVRVRAFDWPPYLVIRKKEPPQGISAEYLKLIQERTGINFEYEVTNQPFSEFIESMKQVQGPDMSPLMVQTPEREEYISFSTPYIFTPYVIFAREQDRIFLDINDLTRKTVAVTRGHVMQQFLERDFPEIRLLLFENDEQALLELSTGNVDAFIGNLSVSTNIIQKRGLSNVRVVASTPYGDQLLSMGNRKDWPELTSIINMALASITEEEKTAIQNKYIALRYEQGLNKVKVILWILSIIAIATAILLLFVFWNRQLAVRIRLRTDELQESVQSLATEVNERLEVEKALIAKEAEELALINAVDNNFFLMKTDGTIVVANKGLAERYGKELQGLVGTNTYDYLPEEIAKKRREHVSQVISSGEASIFEDEDSGRFLEHRLYPIKDDSGVVHKLAVFATDITERKNAEKRIHTYQERLKSLASQLSIVEQEERRRIATGLHDHIGQILAFSRLQLARAQKKAHDEDQQVLLDDISQSLLQVIEDTRELIFDLSSPLLNEIGLDAAITDWLENQVKKTYGLEYSFRHDNVTIELSELERTILFRNFKELVVNVVKHAQASRIEIHLGGNEENVFLSVTDNGLGFNPEQLGKKNASQGGYGLFSIYERMADIGGTIEIDSGTQKGSTIAMRVPVYFNEKELSK